MRSIIDKANLAKVIAAHMNTRYEQPGSFLEWANRNSTTAGMVLRWATEADIREAQEKYNEIQG